MDKFLFLINIGAIFALLCAYISPFISPELTWFFSFFGLMFPVILFFNILFVIFWLFKKPQFAWLGLIVIIMGYNPIFRLLNFNTVAKSESSFQLLSYNIQGSQIFYGKTEKEKEAKFNEFKSFLESVNHVDILCLQELGLSTQKKLSSVLNNYHSIDTIYKGTKVYSKFPIVNSGNIELGSISHNAAWTDLKIKTDTIRVYSIHLSSNRVGNKTDQILEDPDISENKFWSGVKYVLKKYSHHAKIRSTQLEKILQHANQSKYPLIISGDFNDVTQSYVYSQISKNYTDGFTKAGNGLGSTYRYYLPALRIDYIFADSRFRFLKHRVLDNQFSDHYPILGTMCLDK